MPVLCYIGEFLLVQLYYTLLTKTTAAQNEVALCYYRVRGQYFLAGCFCGDYYSDTC